MFKSIRCPVQTDLSVEVHCQSANVSLKSRFVPFCKIIINYVNSFKLHFVATYIGSFACSSSNPTQSRKIFKCVRISKWLLLRRMRLMLNDFSIICNTDSTMWIFSNFDDSFGSWSSIKRLCFLKCDYSNKYKIRMNRISFSNVSFK